MSASTRPRSAWTFSSRSFTARSFFSCRFLACSSSLSIVGSTGMALLDASRTSDVEALGPWAFRYVLKSSSRKDDEPTAS